MHQYSESLAELIEMFDLKDLVLGGIDRRRRSGALHQTARLQATIFIYPVVPRKEPNFTYRILPRSILHFG
jgi:hypothetical protein